jgi:hypothetical protein
MAKRSAAFQWLQSAFVTAAQISCLRISGIARDQARHVASAHLRDGRRNIEIRTARCRCENPLVLSATAVRFRGCHPTPHCHRPSRSDYFHEVLLAMCGFDPAGTRAELLSPPCSDLPVGRFVDRAVQPPLQKYFASPSGRNRNRANPSRPTQRGVSRSSRT